MMWFKCKYNRYQNCDIDEPETACDGCDYGLKYLKDNKPYRCAVRPCKYDRYNPCEYCGKCSNNHDEEDPDREYERARDEGRL